MGGKRGQKVGKEGEKRAKREQKRGQIGDKIIGKSWQLVRKMRAKWGVKRMRQS